MKRTKKMILKMSWKIENKIITFLVITITMTKKMMNKTTCKKIMNKVTSRKTMNRAMNKKWKENVHCLFGPHVVVMTRKMDDQEYNE